MALSAREHVFHVGTHALTRWPVSLSFGATSTDPRASFTQTRSFGLLVQQPTGHVHTSVCVLNTTGRVPLKRLEDGRTRVKSRGHRGLIALTPIINHPWPRAPLMTISHPSPAARSRLRALFIAHSLSLSLLFSDRIYYTLYEHCAQ